ncbi:glycosyltransferase [Sphingomonas alpina]|uniref:Glycosyltransferase n=1 Tax=Sphingomonas alpina TaxID=653931 RepID=A0A7H0LFW8_9SPHN|nr:glycosyltransferase [Sphingomonas alpina]QNQ08571.1 glycosyltransferase [Sphingomonas alpina]
MEIIALFLLATPILVYAGYLIVLAAAAAFAKPRAIPPAEDIASISIVICAHNEAARIGAKLETVLASASHWPGVCEILVADDGSSDATAVIVEGFAARGVQFVRLPRGGKAAALNRIVPMARGDIVVMSDADPLFDEATLPALIAPFADPGVGAVAGAVETIRTGKRGRFAGSDILFRWYESTLRSAEDRLFGCISADGGLYAIRTALVPTVPASVTDDFWISTGAVAAGYRIAFAPDARVHEESIAGDRQQFRRRVRITVRGLTGLWQRRALMNPATTGWYAVALVLHKVARRLAPLALVPLLPLSGILAFRDGPGWSTIFWALVFAGLLSACLLGLVGFLTGMRLPRPLALGYGAVLHLAGLAAGVTLFALGRRYAQWTPDKTAA